MVLACVCHAKLFPVHLEVFQLGQGQDGGINFVYSTPSGSLDWRMLAL